MTPIQKPCPKCGDLMYLGGPVNDPKNNTWVCVTCQSQKAYVREIIEEVEEVLNKSRH